MAYIYMLQSKTGQFYVGSTTNLRRRLSQYRKAHTFTTKNWQSFKLVFSTEVRTIAIARNAEKRIKSWKRKDYIQKIITDGRINFLEA